MKTCSKCKENKCLDEFFSDRKSKTGVQSQCKLCKLDSVKKSPSQSCEMKRNYEKRRKGRKEYKRAYHHKTKLARNVSRRIRQSLAGSQKSIKWQLLTGYTLEDLKVHLESKFSDEMNWNNYGSYWHIDHKKPIHSFEITSETCDEFKSCWSLENLQPLKAVDNLKKGKKVL